MAGGAVHFAAGRVKAEKEVGIMHIVVCVKHVLDSTEIRVDKKTGDLVLRGIPAKINDYDKNAIEEAVKIKKACGGEISLVSIGPREAVKTLKSALAMGADNAYLLLLPPRQALDTRQTALVLGRMIKKLGPVDMVLCGEVSEDGYNSQTGARLAQRLGLPQVSYVTKLTCDGTGYEAQRTLEDVVETVKGDFPVVFTVNSGINVPHLPTAIQIMKVRMNRIQEWKPGDIGLEDQALSASAVKMLSYEIPTQERKNIILDGPAEEAAGKLWECLQKEAV